LDPAEEQRWNAEALAGGVDLPAVRVWTYDRAAVVLGRSQRADDAHAARARRAGVDLYERATGGGAVLVGPWMLAASVVLPPDHPLVDRSIAASYEWIGEAHASWLRDAGIPARIVPRPTDPGELRWACFAGRSHGEVEVDGRKIVGLAQARRRAGVLFSAGMLLSTPAWEVLCDVMGKPAEAARSLEERTTSCVPFVGKVSVAGAACGVLARLSAAVTGGGSAIRVA
jgi:lipoate-protein ligase A